MADNVVLSVGTADGATIATDQDASAPSAHYQINKIAFGALNTFTLVTASAGLPVAVVGTVTVDGSGVTQPVSNAGLTELAAAINASSQMDVNLAANGIGIATSAKQDTIITAVQLLDDSVVVLGTDVYTEATSKGYAIGAVRRDADTTLASLTNEWGPLQMDANGRLKVEAFSGEALPVTLTSTTITGTVAVTQSGTWDEVGINDSGNSITVDNGGTFAVQIDAGAVTSLALLDDVVVTLGTTTYTEATSKGNAIGAVRRDADTTLVDTTNEWGPLQIDANGRLKVEAFSGETLPVSFTGSGDVATQTTLASLLTSSQLIDDVVYTDDTSTHATGTSKGVGIMAAAVPTDTSVNANDIAMVAMTTDRKLHVAVMDALPAGTAAIGKLAANSGVDIGDVDVTSISAGSNLIGDVGIQGRATGGTSTFCSIDLDETEEEVKATAGTIYHIAAFNRTAAPLYLKLYNLTAANTTVGTSTPTHTYVVPANADSDGAGFMLGIPQGIAFSTAISAAVTTAVADADTGAPGANDCVVNIQYV